MYVQNILTKPVKKMKDKTIHKTNRIKNAICKTFNVSETEIDSRSRVYRVAEARHAYVALLRELTQWPVARIARHIHRKDHGTVCNSIQRNADLCEVDWRYNQRVARARFLAQ